MRADPLFMLSEASPEIGRDAGIDAFIFTFKKVNEVGHVIKITFIGYNIYMNITKLGHCCLILENNGKKILTDPGTFTIEQVKEVKEIDTVLITHEHGDHFHIESIQAVIENNPEVIVVSNASVGKLLSQKNIPCMVVGDGQSATVNGMLIEGFGKDHEPIYGTQGLVENTGYFIDGKFYFPGDSFYDLKRPIGVLALPVAGPWLKLSEAIDFAKKVRPTIAFAIHDGMIIPGFGGFVAGMLQNILKSDSIEFVTLDAGEKKEFL
jgi:L-ascorbate metabolism protein UlaG (beta-lactamase superfamily)